MPPGCLAARAGAKRARDNLSAVTGKKRWDPASHHLKSLTETKFIPGILGQVQAGRGVNDKRAWLTEVNCNRLDSQVKSPAAWGNRAHWRTHATVPLLPVSLSGLARC